MSPALNGFCSLPAIALEKLYGYFLIYLACQLLTFQENLLGRLLIGDTETILGCYKLLATLRCLCGWVTTTFKDWLELKVLGPSNLYSWENRVWWKGDNDV